MAIAGSARLTLRQAVGFGVGDLGLSLFFQTTLLYLFYFYTDIALIAPASVATILIVARLVDAVSCPLIGMAADRTRSRWGRFRPYILFGSLPLALMALATFTVFPGTASTRVLLGVASYSLFSICYALVAIPYSALMGTMTASPTERTLLGTFRAGFSFSAGVIVSMAMLPIIKAAGGGSGGFHAAIAAASCLAIPLLWMTFATTQERILQSVAERPSPRDTMRALTTRPMLIMVAIFVLSNLAIMLRSAGAVYFFKYNLGRPELVSIYLTFGAVTTLLGIVSTPFVSRRIGKRRTMIAGVLLVAAGHALMSVMPPTVVSTFVLAAFFPAFGMGLKAATTWPLLADCVDFAEWRHGKRVEGAAYGVAIFGQKLSLAIGGALSGWTLAGTGYVANAVQSPIALTGILALVGYYPAGFMILSLMLAWGYPLTEARMASVQSELGGSKGVHATAEALA